MELGMSVTWIQTLLNLRPRFEAAYGKYPDLRCAMAQVVDTMVLPDEDATYPWHEGRETAEHLLERARWFHFEGAQKSGNSLSTALTPTEWETIDNQPVPVLKPYSYWYFQFFADMAGAKTFYQMADDAGWCLPTKPYPQVPDLPEKGGLLRERGRWLFLVFHLAWLRLPGWVLRGDRGCIWPQHGKIDRDVFYSALPLNPFQASVEAIDILSSTPTAPVPLNGDPTGEPKRPRGRPIKYPLSLEYACQLLSDPDMNDIGRYNECKKKYGKVEKLPNKDSFMRTARIHAARRASRTK
jgi:hypothetical protein